VKFIEDDFALRVGEMVECRGRAGIPHIHGNGLDSVNLLGR
jgi:hypothetical protein